MLSENEAIQGHLRDLYGIDASPQLISTGSDRPPRSRARFTQCSDELLPVARKLAFADAADSRELTERSRAPLDHLAQRGVVKNDVGRQALSVRQLLAQFAQPLEQFVSFS